MVPGCVQTGPCPLHWVTSGFLGLTLAPTPARLMGRLPLPEAHARGVWPQWVQHSPQHIAGVTVLIHHLDKRRMCLLSQVWAPRSHILLDNQANPSCLSFPTSKGLADLEGLRGTLLPSV